jgi:membrane peptidoglycan carboxypeptidase
MVGYTPSLSAAVWVGNDNPNVPIENAEGAIVYGAGLPGAVWQKFMDTVLAGTPEEELPDRAVIRGDTGEGVAEPRTEPQAAPSSSSPPTRSAPEPEPEPEAPAPAPSTPTETVTDPPADTVPGEVGTGQVGGPPGAEDEDTTLGGQDGGDGDERAEGEPAPEPAPETEATTQPEPRPVG